MTARRPANRLLRPTTTPDAVMSDGLLDPAPGGWGSTVSLPSVHNTVLVPSVPTIWPRLLIFLASVKVVPGGRGNSVLEPRDHTRGTVDPSANVADPAASPMAFTPFV